MRTIRGLFRIICVQTPAIEDLWSEKKKKLKEHPPSHLLVSFLSPPRSPGCTQADFRVVEQVVGRAGPASSSKPIQL